ncbi:MAG: Fe-S cluster assembly ATPase SufC [Candidatus Babeliales bacterium]
MTILSVNNLTISINKTTIIKDFSLTIEQGKVHAIMGPNGSGKSTLAYTLMGHPNYTIERGSILLDGQDITHLSPDKRSKQGLFLAFQQPQEIPGVSVIVFLKEMCQAIKGTDFITEVFPIMVEQRMRQLQIDSAFLYRNLNDGFSGGEKKRFEMLQLLLFEPKVVILDEIDSGLDIDALKIVAQGLMLAKKENSVMSILLITHYQRILDYITPDNVHVLCDGQLVTSGGPELAIMLEQKGYDGYRKEAK